MICGTGIHDQLRAPVVHNNGHVQLVRELQHCATPQFCARLDHLQACTTRTSATLSKNCTTTGVSTTLSKTGQTPATTCTRGSSTPKQLRDNNGHVSNLVQELHGPHSERPQENHGHVNILVQELHDATRRRPIPCTIREPTLGLPGAALDDVIMTVVSLCTGLGSPRGRGSLSRRRRHRTDKPSRQQLPRECHPSSDSSRCTCRPLGSPATVTPGRLLASPVSPRKGRTDWLLSPLHHDTVAGPRRVVVVVVEWSYYFKRIIIVRWADLSEFFSFIFVGKMCVFVSRPMKIVTFLRKNVYPPKRVVDFPLERDTIRNKIMEIVEDFDEKSYNNNCKPWKSLRILRVNPFFHFSFFFHHFFRFFFFFFHFFIFFFIFHFFLLFFIFYFLFFTFLFFFFFIFPIFYFYFIYIIFFNLSFFIFYFSHFICIFFIFSFLFHFFFFFNFSFSIIFFHFLNFFHVLSFSFIFFHFLSFSCKF